MKRSEIIALITFLSLIGAAVTLGGMIMYSGLWLDRGYLNIALLAGAVAALSQTFVAVLAYWGLKLTRQTHELSSIPGETTSESTSQTPALGAFRMSAPDDVANEQKRRARTRSTYESRNDQNDVEVRTLETGFQRTVVILAASFMLIAAAALAFLLYRQYDSFAKDPSLELHIAKVDPLIFTVVVGVAGVYLALFRAARVRKETEGFGDAIAGLLTLALPGAIAVAAGITLAWAGVNYATEIAAGVVIFILVIQSLELFVNALRSFAGVEELEQEPVDLQATPLIPMLSSVWINGLRMLMGQSFGVSDRAERGVISRMMPRVIVAVIIVGIAASCIHVVPIGHKAILERFGSVEGYAQGPEAITANALGPGVHILLPWPMDRLVLIPEERLQESDVGAELEPKKGMEDLDLWNIPHAKPNEEGQFITGNLNSEGLFVGRIIESHGKVWWRVEDPGKYYMALSHSDAFEANTKESGTKALPMNELMVARIANRALTRAFAEVNGNVVMISGREKLEARMREIMEKDIETLKAGIKIVGLSINDIHPPYGKPDYSAKKFGPAGAFEDYVAAQQDVVTIARLAEAEADTFKARGSIESYARLSDAEAYSKSIVAEATGSSKYQLGTIDGFRQYPFAAATRQRFMDLMDAVAPNQKVLVAPGVEPPIIIQEGKFGSGFPLGN